MLRLALLAGLLVSFVAATDAKPVWRHYPPPGAFPQHEMRVVVRFGGPVWRHHYYPSGGKPVAAVTALVAPSQPGVEPVAVEPAAIAVATAPVVARPPPPVAVAKAAEPKPQVVAQTEPPKPPKPTEVALPMPAEIPAPTAVAMEEASQPDHTADYIAAIVMAIVIGGVIILATRQRRAGAA